MRKWSILYRVKQCFADFKSWLSRPLIYLSSVLCLCSPKKLESELKTCIFWSMIMTVYACFYSDLLLLGNGSFLKTGFISFIYYVKNPHRQLKFYVINGVHTAYFGIFLSQQVYVFLILVFLYYSLHYFNGLYILLLSLGFD